MHLLLFVVGGVVVLSLKEYTIKCALTATERKGSFYRHEKWKETEMMLDVAYAGLLAKMMAQRIMAFAGLLDWMAQILEAQMEDSLTCMQHFVAIKMEGEKAEWGCDFISRF